MTITSRSAIYLADLQYCHSGDYRGMAGLPLFGTVNVGTLSNAIAVAIQQASVSRPSSGQAQPPSSRSRSDGQECGSG